MSILFPIPHGLDYCGFIVRLKIRWGSPLALFFECIFFFQNCFAMSGPLLFIYIFKISLSISINKPDERVTYPRSHNSYALESAQSPIIVMDPSSRSDSGPHTDD